MGRGGEVKGFRVGVCGCEGMYDRFPSVIDDRHVGVPSYRHAGAPLLQVF